MTRSLIAAFTIVALATLAPAQYYPPPYPYPPYVNRGTGATMQGAASFVDASGNLFIQQEQARVEREKANQAKLDTKKKTFDEMMYEKANTPTFTEDQAKINAMTLRRVMSDPQQAEVTSGKAQNLMLPYLKQIVQTGIQGPPVALDQNMLKSINVTTGGKDGFSVGILKSGGELDWPIAVLGPTQKKLAPKFPQLVSGAATGMLDAKLYLEVNKGVAAMQEELRKKFHKEEIDGGMYLEGKRFLDSLDNSMKALRQPSASKVLSGSLAASGRNVPELVQNMTAKGLSFAPATPGNEAPYFSLYSSMVAYANGATDPNAFQAQYQKLAYPIRKDFSKGP